MKKTILILIILCWSFLINMAFADNVGTIYDNFGCQNYTLSDGETSPNGKWVNWWNGGGNSGIKVVNDNNVFYEKPQTASSENTFSTLVVSSASWDDFEVSFDARTESQLKDSPFSWEVDWFLFRFTNLHNYYYFIHKTNGIELGKKQGGDSQIFLITNSGTTKKIDQWYHYHIKTVGNHIQIWIDNSLVIDYTDEYMSSKLSSGQFGLYTEDALVNFDNVSVKDIK